MGPFGLSLGLYVENLQVLSSLFGQVWCCMLATYIVLKRHVGASLGLDVGNLQVLWGLLGQVFVLYVGILLVYFGPSLVLYVGNLQEPAEPSFG